MRLSYEELNQQNLLIEIDAIKMKDIRRLKNLVLVLLAKGFDKDEAYFNVNWNRYNIPLLIECIPLKTI